MSSLLTVNGIKTYFWEKKTGSSVKACDDLDITVGNNEIVGLVGESGCGKSTLGRTIVGLEEPVGGSILYDNVNILELSGERRRIARRSIQYLFQDSYSALSPRQTIGQALDEALLINGEKSGASRSRRSLELLEAVGLHRQILERYPRQTSGGQRQRACIARALAANPKLLICDEPFSSLDVSIRAQIMNLFLKLRDDLGMSFLIIAHDLAVVRQTAERVYVMYLGKIVESGSVEDVYGNPSHPYTQSLLSAVPSANPVIERQRKKIVLSGDLPSPINPPGGCRFHTRCPVAQQKCDTVPKVATIVPGHVVSCHFPGEVVIDSVH